MRSNIFPEKKDGKYDLLFNDYVINPDVCNFRCQYCLSNDAPKEYFGHYKNYKIAIQEKDDICLKKYEDIINAKILRLSGGEILLNINLVEWIKTIHNRYESIQILTNGYNITNDFLSEIKKMGNVYLHISIDGHSYNLNRYRVKGESEQERLIENLKLCQKHGIHFEIGSVMTNANVSQYSTFLDFLLHDFNVMVYPFPVRGDEKKEFYASARQILDFEEKVLGNYQKYEKILPAKIYVKNVVKALKGDNITNKCYIPYFGIQTFNSGKCTPCMNFWERFFGNIFESKNVISEKLSTDKLYYILGRRPLCIKYCYRCYTSLDIFNLYLNSEIGERDLKKIKILGPKSLGYLRQKREKIANENK